MAGKADNLEVRHEFILHRLQAGGEVTIDELCASLKASVTTIRRDLDDLEQRSLLRRTHGGAIPIGPLFYEPFKHDASFQDMLGSFAAEKRRIARAAADLVHKGDTVALSGGTTTTEVVRCLKLLGGITIITNAVNVAMELSSCEDVNVLVTGGQLRGNRFTLVGPLANQSAQMLFADIMFISVDGIDAEQGLTCTHPHAAELLRTLARHCKQRVVVTDHSKIGRVAKWLLCPTADIHSIITDDGALDDMVAPFLRLGIKVMRV